jgi:hypothetical protein
MKKLLNLSIAILLTSIVISQSGCLKDQVAEQYPDATATADTVNGTVKLKQTDIYGTNVVSWKFGEATISAIAAGTDVIATAKVNADGTFALVLPATIPGIYFSYLADAAYKQGGTIKVTPDAVRLFGNTTFNVDYTDKGLAKSMVISLATLNTDLSVNRKYYFNFYDLDGTFIGKGSSGNVFNWTFTKGWGIVESYITNSTSNIINSKSVIAAPTTAVWLN